MGVHSRQQEGFAGKDAKKKSVAMKRHIARREGTGIQGKSGQCCAEKGVSAWKTT